MIESNSLWRVHVNRKQGAYVGMKVDGAIHRKISTDPKESMEWRRMSNFHANPLIGFHQIDYLPITVRLTDKSLTF